MKRAGIWVAGAMVLAGGVSRSGSVPGLDPQATAAAEIRSSSITAAQVLAIIISVPRGVSSLVGLLGLSNTSVGW